MEDGEPERVFYPLEKDGMLESCPSLYSDVLVDEDEPGIDTRYKSVLSGMSTGPSEF